MLAAGVGLVAAFVGLALVPHGLRNTFGLWPSTGVRSHNLAQLAQHPGERIAGFDHHAVARLQAGDGPVGEAVVTLPHPCAESRGGRHQQQRDDGYVAATAFAT